MTPVAITGFGWVDAAGMRGGRGELMWAALGIAGMTKLRWRQFSDQPFDRYARLDRLSRCSMAAVEMMGLAVPDTEQLRPRGGVVMGTRYGCVAVDADFCRSTQQVGGASPLLFAYTLPSSAAGEIAIRYRMTGDHLCLMAEEESYFAAVYEAYCLVAHGELEQCICIVADATGDQSSDRDHDADAGQNDYALAMMFENTQAASDAGSDVLATLAMENHATGEAMRPGDVMGIFERCLGGGKQDGKQAAVIDSRHGGKVRIDCQRF